MEQAFQNSDLNPSDDAKNGGGGTNGTERNVFTPQFPGLSDVQRRAIELTILGWKDTRICRAIGIGRTTLWRWKTEDENFVELLHLARVQTLGHTVDKYQTLLYRATRELEKGLKDSDPDKRFRAARTVLGMAGVLRPSPRPEKSLAHPWTRPMLEAK